MREEEPQRERDGMKSDPLDLRWCSPRKAGKNKESQNGLSHPGFDATRFMRSLTRFQILVGGAVDERWHGSQVCDSQGTVVDTGVPSRQGPSFARGVYH
jgi:hypothetical protein